MKYKVSKSWAPEDTFSFQGDNGQTVTLRTHVVDLEGGQKISVSKKPDFNGFEVDKEYDFDISTEKSKSGKTFKAKHITQISVCPKCGHTGSGSEFRQSTPVSPPEPRRDAQSPQTTQSSQQGVNTSQGARESVVEGSQPDAHGNYQKGYDNDPDGISRMEF